MIKIITMLITALILLLTSCAASYPTSGPAVTIVPNRVQEYDNYSNADEVAENTQENVDESADFKALRESFRAVMESMPRERELSPTSLEYMLLDYKEGSIILACRFLGWYNVSSPDYPPDLQDISLSNNIQIMFIAANEFTFEGGKLVDKGIISAPVLVKTGLGDNDIEKIFLPEMYDETKREEDIKEIFGEYADEVTAEVSKFRFAASLSQVSKVQYKAFLSGAFDPFPNQIIDKQKELIANNLFDTTTIEGTIRQYYAENNFRYSSLTLPIWYEYGREEDGEGISPIIYSEMYYGELYLTEENILSTNYIVAPNYIRIITKNDKYEVWHLAVTPSFLDDYTELFEGTNYPEEYINAHDEFLKSNKYTDFLAHCDSVMEGIFHDTFDYSSDSLTFAP